MTLMKEIDSNPENQGIQAGQTQTILSAVEHGLCHTDIGRFDTATFRDAAWLTAFFLKHNRSPSDQEMEDHAWSVEFQEQNGRPPVLDDWIDRYSKLRYPG